MAGQSSEEEMYNNESAGPALEEFLHLLGERVRLKGFTKYRAQLDTKSMCTPLMALNQKHPQLQAKNSSHFRNCFQVNKDRIFNSVSQIMGIVLHHLCIIIYNPSAAALPLVFTPHLFFFIVISQVPHPLQILLSRFVATRTLHLL